MLTRNDLDGLDCVCDSCGFSSESVIRSRFQPDIELWGLCSDCAIRISEERQKELEEKE